MILIHDPFLFLLFLYHVLLGWLENESIRVLMPWNQAFYFGCLIMLLKKIGVMSEDIGRNHQGRP